MQFELRASFLNIRNLPLPRANTIKDYSKYENVGNTRWEYLESWIKTITTLRNKHLKFSSTQKL
jgi:hypothetical protein